MVLPHRSAHKLVPPGPAPSAPFRTPLETLTQMSIPLPYACPRIISGATYDNVPAIVCWLAHQLSTMTPLTYPRQVHVRSSRNPQS
jgi:hypothetical protein